VPNYIKPLGNQGLYLFKKTVLIVE
jgi:hypothetical protein